MTAALGAGLIAVGTGAVVVPRLAAAMFGLPTEDRVALAFVGAAGVRDAVLGTLVFALWSDEHAVQRVLRISSLIALADAITLAAMRGVRPQHILHLGGFAALLLASEPKLP